MVYRKEVNMKKGFTLIELLVVLILLGNILIITVPKIFEQFGAIQKKCCKIIFHFINKSNR